MIYYYETKYKYVIITIFKLIYIDYFARRRCNEKHCDNNTYY